MSEPPTQNPPNGEPWPTGVVPAPDGLRPQQLQYVVADRRGAPGLIVTIGVLSIVIASLSGIYNLVTGLQAVGFYMMSLMTTSMASASAASRARVMTPPVAVQASPALSVQADGSPPVGVRGMQAKEREAAAAALNARQPLTPSRRRQLDAILALAGQDMATGNVTGSGTMEAMDSSERPPDFFTTTAGRFELFNDRAVFYPLRGLPVRASAPPEGTPAPQVSAAPQAVETVQAPPGRGGPIIVGSATAPSTQPMAVRTAAPGPPPGPPPASGPSTMPLVPAAQPLTAAEIQSVVQQAQSASGNGLNAAQVNGLQALLASPGQQLVQAGGSQGAVVSAVAQAGGPVVLGFADGGSLTLGPQGNVVSMMVTPILPTFSIHPLAIGLALVTALASVALAIYLLVCGIVTIRQSPRGRRLHLVYACIKIPLAITAGIASEWVMRDLMAGVAGSTGAAPRPMALSFFSGVIPAVIGCAYPIALLVALNLRQVRDYYDYGAGDGRAAAG